MWVWVCDPWFSTEVGQAAWLALGTSMSGILRAWRVAAGKPGDWETELDRSSGEASKRVGGEPLSLRAWRRLLHAVGRERRRCPPPSGHPSAPRSRPGLRLLEASRHGGGRCQTKMD